MEKEFRNTIFGKIFFSPWPTNALPKQEISRSITAQNCFSVESANRPCASAKVVMICVFKQNVVI